MADTPISALPLRTLVTDTDEVPTVAGGVNYRSPVSSFVGLGNFSTQVHLIDLMSGAQRAALESTVSSEWPYIDDVFDEAYASLPSISPYTGGEIIFPRGRMRFATTKHIKKRTKFIGESGGSRGNRSTLLVFDDNIDGFVVHRSNTGPDGEVSPSTTSGEGSHFEWLCIEPSTVGTLSGGVWSGTTSGSGLWMRGVATVQNCTFANWGEHGIKIVAVIDHANPFIEGNANCWYIANTRISGSKSHGLYVIGADSNAGTAVMMEFSTNGGYGVLDESFLGNCYVGCHAANNTLGAYATSDNSSESIFVGCYSEADQPTNRLTTRTILMGGLDGAGTRAWPTLGGDTAFPMHMEQGTLSPFAVDHDKYKRSVAINRAAGDIIQISIDGDPGEHGFPAYNGTDGTLQVRYDQLVVSQRFTTGLSDMQEEVFVPGVSGIVGGATPATVAWSANTAYAVGTKVLNDSSKTYVCATAGRSAGNPAWAASTPYEVFDLVTNGLHPTRIYKCTTRGTSAASGGPSGTSTSILDGTARWDHVLPLTPQWTAPTAYVAGDMVTNDGGKVYAVDTPGTSAAAHPAWTPNTYYQYGSRVSNAGNNYVIRKRGWSAASGGPTGGATSGLNLDGKELSDGHADPSDSSLAWVANKVYAVGNYIHSRGLTYICTAVTGDARSSPLAGDGPRGVGQAIVDDAVTWAWKDGCTWDYAPGPGPTGTYTSAYGTHDGTVVWNYQQTTAGPILPTVLTGPAGTGRNIADGSVVWNYQSIGPGQMVMDGVWVPNTSDTAYRRLNLLPVLRQHQQQTIVNGSSVVLTALASPSHLLLTGTQTADRTVSLVSSSGGVLAKPGQSFKITRASGGAFNMTVGIAGTTAWVADTVYSPLTTTGALRTNGGNTYTLIVPGTSAGTGTAWVAGTNYTVLGTVRTNGGNWYKLVDVGVAGSTGPTGIGSSIPDGTAMWDYLYPPWTASTTFYVGQIRTNDGGKLYRCITQGNSAASGGPTGTGASITDNVAKWDYLAAVPITGPAGTGNAIADGTCVWAYQTVPLTTLATNTWCEVVWSGTEWYLEARGSLI